MGHYNLLRQAWQMQTILTFAQLKKTKRLDDLFDEVSPYYNIIQNNIMNRDLA